MRASASASAARPAAVCHACSVRQHVCRSLPRRVLCVRAAAWADTPTELPRMGLDALAGRPRQPAHTRPGALRSKLLGDKTCLVVRPVPHTTPSAAAAAAAAQRTRHAFTDAAPPAASAPGASAAAAEAAAAAGASDAPRPYLLYLPDIDGCGAAAKAQWRELDAVFDLFLLQQLPEDRTPFSGLVEAAEAHINKRLAGIPAERTAYLVGEGTGALVALAVATRCKSINRLVLVNPATCYSGSALAAAAGPTLDHSPGGSGGGLAQAAAAALGPLAMGGGRALRAAMGGVLAGARLPGLRSAGGGDNGGGGARGQAGPGLLAQLPALLASLPPATLAWRLAVLQEGLQHASTCLPQVEQRTMVVAGGGDAVLPAAKEAARLATFMQRAFARVLPGRGHQLLQAPGVSLLGLMREEGFYAPTRAFTTPMPKDGGAVLGFAGPVERPSKEEVARYAGRWNRLLQRFSSPVFVSTREDGTVVEGLAGLPDDMEGPVLFCGNHQVLGFDMNVLFEEMYLQKGLLLRGLAHPGLMLDNGLKSQMRGSTELLTKPIFEFTNALRTFGAVPVTPTNFYRLLQRGESVLLYPGGVREGFKRKGEKYQLFWPGRAEFVRMAARFGATIVPFASVGAEDCVNLVMDSDELAQDELLSPFAHYLAELVPEARVGVTEAEDCDQTFIPPLAAPSMPARLYYMARRPIKLDPSLAKDKEGADAAYAAIKAEVEAGLAYLLKARETDPYRDLLPRMLYESPNLALPLVSTARRVQAPSFKVVQPAALGLPS